MLSVLAEVHVQIDVQVIVIEQLRRWFHRWRIRLLFMPQTSFSPVLSGPKNQRHVTIQHFQRRATLRPDTSDGYLVMFNRLRVINLVTSGLKRPRKSQYFLSFDVRRYFQSVSTSMQNSIIFSVTTFTTVCVYLKTF